MEAQKNPTYTFIKNNVYYFSKSVPVDLRSHYSKHRIVQSLRTKSAHNAKAASQSLSAKLENYWLGLRLQKVDVPAAHLLIDYQSSSSRMPTIEDALEHYLRVKGDGRSPLFFQHAKRNIEYVSSCLGTRSIDQYNTADAATFRDWLVDKGLSHSSVKRIFGGIKAIVNFSITEEGLSCSNPFTRVYLPNDLAATTREPIGNSDLLKLQSACLSLDDDIRWLVALISDTGMRLSEAVGLQQSDFIDVNGVPLIDLKPHPNRRLKTATSTRQIPLSGMASWATSRIRKEQDSLFCFPRYCTAQKCHSNSASAAVNKWLKTVTHRKATIHGLRHSFRDRLRAVEAPVDLVDQLGGWSLTSVGQNYGNGYPVKLLHEWLEKIIITPQ